MQPGTILVDVDADRLGSLVPVEVDVARIGVGPQHLREGLREFSVELPRRQMPGGSKLKSLSRSAAEASKRKTPMRMVIVALAFALSVSTNWTTALAHDDAPHPKCKKGYFLNDDHKCVKAGN